MKKLLFALTVITTISFPALAETNARNAYIDKAQAWISNLTTAQTRFDQIDHQGNVMHGTFSINRPGKLRFEYDAPVKDYIVADGYLIHFYDGVSEQVISGPIGSTLADFILRDGDNFDESIKIESVHDNGDHVSITVSQANQPGMGELILNFQHQPFELKSWKIIDAQGLTTDIVLHDLNREVKISPSLFRVDNLNLNE